MVWVISRQRLASRCARTAFSCPTMSVTWPSNSRRISAFKLFVAAGVAGQMVQIDRGCGQAEFPVFRPANYARSGLRPR